MNTKKNLNSAHETAQDNGVDKVNDHCGAEADVKRTQRRQLLKAGLLAAPFVLTFKSQPVWALQDMQMSGASPWYRGPWDADGNVLSDDGQTILKYHDPNDPNLPADWDGPVGGGSEMGVER